MEKSALRNDRYKQTLGRHLTLFMQGFEGALQFKTRQSSFQGNDEERRGLKETMLQLKAKSAEFIGRTDYYKQAAIHNRGASQVLNAAIDRLTASLDGINSLIRNVLTFCDRMIALLEDGTSSHDLLR